MSIQANPGRYSFKKSIADVLQSAKFYCSLWPKAHTPLGRAGYILDLLKILH
jgi:hypothetical protein